MITENTYYTTNGLEITDRIDNDLTRYFKSYKKAYAFASHKRSYVYPLTKHLTDNNKRKTEYGFGVPA